MLRLFSAASNSVSPKPKTRRHLAFEQVEARALLAANIASSEFYEAGLIGPPLIEPLPPEALGSITFDPSTGVVTIDGSDAHDDKLDIHINHGTADATGASPDLITVSLANINSPLVQSFAPGTVQKIIFSGLAGNDTVDNRTSIPLAASGGPGHDVLIGGTADDLLAGGDDNDFLDGRRGNDSLLGEAGLDALFGDDGFDRLYGGTNTDYLFGGSGDDDLRGEAGNDRLYGEAGTDRLLDSLGVNTKYTDYGPTTYNLSASGFVAFDWFDRNLKDPDLRSLTRTSFRDGILDRQDMLTIYTLVATDGVVSGTPHIGVVTTSELSDLKALLTTKLNFQIDTRYFAAKIANGDPANARYHGAALGNLSAGASGAHLNKLVDKWFQGGDLPAIRATDSAQYGHVTGSLFQNGISYTDVDQGVADDCYFLAALGEVAQHSPATIYKMFTDNGDSTYSVRFFKNGASVFVTVNQDLPIDANNMAVYAGWGGAQSYSSTNELWVALAEKAYAQLNESGGINQDGTNTYAGIGYGWPANAFKQIVGKSASDQTFTSSISLVNAATAGRAITLLSKTSGVANNIVPNHAYMLIGYNAQTKRFLLYNPWGTTNTLSDGHDRPTILNLTFAQLQNNFTNWTSLLI